MTKAEMTKAETTSKASKATTRAKTTTAATSAAVREFLGTRQPSRTVPGAHRRCASYELVVVLSCLMALALLLPAAAGASDATLRVTLANWSQRIALDASGISLSASRRHPRRMARRARHFRADALRVERALASVPPSTIRGRRAKRLALAAFRDYAVVGREWALSGQARVHGQTLAAVAHAHTAAHFARSGSRRLIAAGKLLR